VCGKCLIQFLVLCDVLVGFMLNHQGCMLSKVSIASLHLSMELANVRIKKVAQKTDNHCDTLSPNSPVSKGSCESRFAERHKENTESNS